MDRRQRRIGKNPRAWKASVATLLTTLLSATAAAEPPPHAEDCGQIGAAPRSIGIFSRSESRHLSTAEIRIEAPTEAVWSVLTDFERWPATFVAIETVSLQRTADGHLTLRQVSEKLGFEVAYTSTLHIDRHTGTVEQSLDPRARGDVQAAHFVWTVTPAPDGRTTIARLQAHFESSQPVPRSLERRMVARSIQNSVQQLATEAERRHQRATRLIAQCTEDDATRREVSG